MVNDHLTFVVPFAHALPGRSASVIGFTAAPVSITPPNRAAVPGWNLTHFPSGPNCAKPPALLWMHDIEKSR
jgi:hypothetical protein